MKLLFDIGGTHTRIAVSKDNLGFGEPTVYPTPQNFEEGLEKFISSSQELLHGQRPQVVAGGIAGVLNSKKTKLINAINIPDWNQKPFYKELFKAFGCEVYVQNDAIMAGLGETGYGAGKGLDLVAYLTFGTGVGGAIFYKNTVIPSTMGFEPGYQIINNEQNLTLGEFVGGRNLELTPESPMITDENFLSALARNVAIGVHNSIVHWSPEMVIMGGGLVNNNIIKVELVTQHLLQIMEAFPRLPKIERSVLGDSAGLYGALVYSQE